MPYRDNPFIGLGRQFDEMLNEMENRFRSLMLGSGGFLPAGGLGPGGFGDRLMPAVRGEFRLDVREDQDEVLVVADLPGVERENITVRLLSPDELEIACERRSERQEGAETGQFYRQERTFGYMSRVIPLPHEVTAEGARSSFTNGVLEIRLKKTTVERGTRIPIE
ncbi:MAG TPA: Hsp20/alpha crystallin family protein [Methanoregulaceae archaeon]|nr:Hsp20/alpha crystallin family protein [Methanoregulaceae archaeon]HOV67013.1 Hsp20/alpha crystallin family protein [Methanoregulaceae archaeon]